MGSMAHVSLCMCLHPCATTLDPSPPWTRTHHCGAPSTRAPTSVKSFRQDTHTHTQIPVSWDNKQEGGDVKVGRATQQNQGQEHGPHNQVVTPKEGQVATHALLEGLHLQGRHRQFLGHGGPGCGMGQRGGIKGDLDHGCWFRDTVSMCAGVFERRGGGSHRERRDASECLCVSLSLSFSRCRRKGGVSRFS